MNLSDFDWSVRFPKSAYPEFRRALLAIGLIEHFHISNELQRYQDVSYTFVNQERKVETRDELVRFINNMADSLRIYNKHSYEERQSTFAIDYDRTGNPTLKFIKN